MSAPNDEKPAAATPLAADGDGNDLTLSEDEIKPPNAEPDISHPRAP
jgi:hypothetical protein